MAFMGILFLALFANSALSASKWDCINYYWRDYWGTVPYDAIPAGQDRNGNNRYIAQVYVRNYELLPGTLLPSEGIALTTAYDKVLRPNQYIKVLCGPWKNAFKWKKIESKDLNNYINKIGLIIGGNEVGEALFIGRVYNNGNPLIAKVFRDEISNRGAWYPIGQNITNSLTYEILWYDCNEPCLPEFNLGFGVIGKSSCGCGCNNNL